MTALDWIVVVAYMLAMLGVGEYYSWRGPEEGNNATLTGHLCALIPIENPARGIAARQIDGHWREPVLAALCASHHHTVGNAAAPYFGSGSGRPKRSQRAVRLMSWVNCGTT